MLLAAMGPGLLDRTLLYVTGKGGVGKTTVAAALGLAAAERGRRTIVCEVAEQERVSRAFARSGSDKFGGRHWVPSPHGSPVLDDVVACRRETAVLVRS